MKKLMIAAAAAAMIGGAYAGDCGEGPADCQTVFTVKFNGKTGWEYKDTYKTVQKFSAKGTLVFDGDYATEAISGKIGKDEFAAVLDCTVGKCTYFGKQLETVLDDDAKKPGKTYTLESDIALDAAGEYTVAGDEIHLAQVAFGKVKVYVTKDKTSKSKGCGDDVVVPGCVNELTPVSYSGWFVGSIDGCLDDEAYNDDCVEFDQLTGTAVVGGTWSAKYDKKNSIKATL